MTLILCFYTVLPLFSSTILTQICHLESFTCSTPQKLVQAPRATIKGNTLISGYLVIRAISWDVNHLVIYLLLLAMEHFGQLIL